MEVGLYFIWMTLTIGTIITAWKLQDIKIELRYKNTLLEDQNEILRELARKIK
jgi:hypothetical protein